MLQTNRCGRPAPVRKRKHGRSKHDYERCRIIHDFYKPNSDIASRTPLRLSSRRPNPSRQLQRHPPFHRTTRLPVKHRRQPHLRHPQHSRYRPNWLSPHNLTNSNLYMFGYRVFPFCFMFCVMAIYTFVLRMHE